MFADLGERLAFGCGLEERAEIVSEDACQDHYYRDWEKDPVTIEMVSITGVVQHGKRSREDFPSLEILARMVEAGRRFGSRNHADTKSISTVSNVFANITITQSNTPINKLGENKV